MSTPRQYIREFLQNSAARAHSRQEPLSDRVRSVLKPILDKYENHRDKNFHQQIMTEVFQAYQDDQKKSQDEQTKSEATLALLQQDAMSLFQKFLRGNQSTSPTCVAVGKMILDDAHFNNKIWPKAERVKEFFHRLSLLSSQAFCMDATLESMADLLHGECHLQPDQLDGDPLYLVRDIPTDIIRLISEHYARKLLLELRCNPTRGFCILRQWMHYHVHGGEKPLTFTLFFNDERSLREFIERKLESNGIDWGSLDLSHYMKIIEGRDELPPPSLPMFGKTSLTLEKIAELNGAIATLYSLVQYPMSLPREIHNAWRDSETLDDIMPLKIPFRFFQLRAKAQRYSNILTISPLDEELRKIAGEIVDASDDDLTKTVDARELALNHCLSKTKAIPDYLRELKAVSREDFYVVFNRLVEKGKILSVEDAIQTLAETESDNLEFHLSPWLLSDVLWQVMTSSPAKWSAALMTLVPKLVEFLRDAHAHPRLYPSVYPWLIETYPIELIEQIDWLYRCSQARTILLCPKVLYMPCNLSGLEIDKQAYSKEELRQFYTALQGRGWWISSPKNLKLTDIVEHPDDFVAILRVCSPIQRQQELQKIWEDCVADPVLFMIIHDVIIGQFGEGALSSLWSWDDRSNQTSAATLPPNDEIGRRKFFSELTEISPARLEIILSFFKETDFDEAFVARHASAIVHFQDPIRVLKNLATNYQMQMRLYAEWCLSFKSYEIDPLHYIYYRYIEEARFIRRIQRSFQSLESRAKLDGLTSRVAARQQIYDQGKLDPDISLTYQRWTSQRAGEPIAKECVDKIALSLEFDTFNDIENCTSYLDSMQQCISSLPRGMPQLVQGELVKLRQQLLESLQHEASFKGKKSQLETEILAVWVRFLDQAWTQNNNRLEIQSILQKIFVSFSEMGDPLCREMKNRLLSQVSEPIWLCLSGRMAIFIDYTNMVEIFPLMSSDRIAEIQTRLMKPSLWRSNLNDCEAHLKCDYLYLLRSEIARYSHSPHAQIIVLAANANLVSSVESFEELIALLSPAVDPVARARLRKSFVEAQPAVTSPRNSRGKKTYAEALRGMNSLRVQEPSNEISTEANDQDSSTLGW